MKQHLPNVLTLSNLLCGSIAVLFAVQSDFVTAALFVFMGIVFDFFDGFVARKLNVHSELGLQLDSLADMVTSGLVPGVVMFKLIASSIYSIHPDPSYTHTIDVTYGDLELSWLPLFGLLITLASAYRLAKFNMDEDQQAYFKGLPTPANALEFLRFGEAVSLAVNFLDPILMRHSERVIVIRTIGLVHDAPTEQIPIFR